MWNGSRWNASQWWGGNWWAGSELPEGSIFASLVGAGLLTATLTAGQVVSPSLPHGGPASIPAVVTTEWPALLLARDDEELAIIVAAFLSVAR